MNQRYIDFVPRPQQTKQQAKPQSRPQPVINVAKPAPRPAAPPAPRPQPTTTVTTVEEVEFGVIEDHAPDANKYVLGGKSPFLEEVTVEKRPLSSSIPVHSEYHLHSTKNVYTKQSPAPDIPKPAPTTVITPSSKKSNVPLVILIFFTIIIGAAVGAGAYFFFFQEQ